MTTYEGFKGVLLLTLLTCLVLLVPCASFAQLSTASLSGLVKDPSGARVQNATVQLRNVTTSVENTTKSNTTGVYNFTSVAPGSYTLQVNASGFSTAQIPIFTLTVAQVASIDVTLTVGAETTVVKVQGATPQLDTSGSNLGMVVARKQVVDLPLNGRNFTQLLLLDPGVVTVSTSQNNNSGVSGSFNVVPKAAGSPMIIPTTDGQTARSDYFYLDGLSNYGSFLSTYAVPPIIDDIQEFSIVSHADNAKFGGVTGGIVNVVTKSGTNQFHGSAWSFYRDVIFDGRPYFLPKTVANSPFHQNQFGGTLGGPVWIPKLYSGKDKTFFFGAYQGFRFSRTSNAPLRVPTAAELAGDESSWPTQIYNPFSTVPDPASPGTYIRNPFPGNQIPPALLSASMTTYAKFIFPVAGPTFDSAGDNALDTTPTTQNQNEWSIRVDQKIGANDSAFFRYSRTGSLVTASGGLPGLLSVTQVPAYNWGGSYVHVFNPSLVLQLLFGHTVYGNLFASKWGKANSDILAAANFSPTFTGNFEALHGGSMLPSPGIAGYSSAGESVYNQPHSTNSYQYSGTVTKTIRRHILSIGGGYISLNFNRLWGMPELAFTAQNTADTNPLDTVNSGDPLASFLLDVPGGATRVDFAEALRPGGVLSAFSQDTWKATSKLTLNFGLRYDLTLNTQYGQNSDIGTNGGPETGDMDFSNGTYILLKLPPTCSVRGHAPCIPGDGALPAHVVVSPNEKLMHNTYDNVGPRLGFAYEINDKTVVNGGFGIMYDNFSAVTQLAENTAGNWPTVGQQIAHNLNQPSTTSARPTVTAENPFGTSTFLPAPTPFDQVSWFYSPNYKNAYSEQWNFGVQRMVSQSTTLKMSYVGSVTRRMDLGGYWNTALTPGPGDPQLRAPYPYIHPTYYDQSTANANYNALQVALNRRFTNGLSYSAAYTWSKAINLEDGWFGVEGSVVQDPYHPRANGSRGVAGTDLPNVLAVSTVYELPFGAGERFSLRNRVLDKILGNWQENNMFQAYSGVPFMPVISSDIANTGNGATYETLDLIGNPHLAHRTPAAWFNRSAYAVPPLYHFGTASRNSLRSDPFWDLDASLFKQVRFDNERSLELRLEAFNLLNHPVFGIPSTDFNSGASFDTIDTTTSSPRELQIAVKLVF